MLSACAQINWICTQQSFTRKKIKIHWNLEMVKKQCSQTNVRKHFDAVRCAVHAKVRDMNFNANIKPKSTKNHVKIN